MMDGKGCVLGLIMGTFKCTIRVVQGQKWFEVHNFRQTGQGRGLSFAQRAHAQTAFSNPLKIRITGNRWTE